MDEKIKVERWTLEDGRKAEKRVMENVGKNGECEKIIELHVEDPKPMRLEQRIVERVKPLLYERTLQTINPVSGEVIEQKTESLEPKVPMQVVEHIVSSSKQEPKCDDANKPVTKQEMIDAIVAAIKANREMSLAAHASLKKCEVKAQGIAEEFQKIQVPQKDGSSLMDKILLVVIAVQVLGLGYILFCM